jgi:hypothetical protein
MIFMPGLEILLRKGVCILIFIKFSGLYESVYLFFLLHVVKGLPKKTVKCKRLVFMFWGIIIMSFYGEQLKYISRAETCVCFRVL